MTTYRFAWIFLTKLRIDIPGIIKRKAALESELVTVNTQAETINQKWLAIDGGAPNQLIKGKLDDLNERKWAIESLSRPARRRLSTAKQNLTVDARENQRHFITLTKSSSVFPAKGLGILIDRDEPGLIGPLYWRGHRGHCADSVLHDDVRKYGGCSFIMKRCKEPVPEPFTKQSGIIEPHGYSRGTPFWRNLPKRTFFRLSYGSRGNGSQRQSGGLPLSRKVRGIFYEAGY